MWGVFVSKSQKWDLGLQGSFDASVGICSEESVDNRESEVGPGEGIQIGLDWLAVTVHPSEDKPISIDQVQLAVTLAFGAGLGDWVQLEYGRLGYQKGMVGPGGGQIFWEAPGRGDVHFILPGKACQLAGERRLRHLLGFAIAHSGKATRSDINLDDYDRGVSPGEVEVVLQGPDAVTHARKGLVQRGFDVGSPDLTGQTTYLGQPSSRQRLRVYDKGLESGGEMDCVRWELQQRHEAADSLIRLLADPTREWCSVVASRLVSFVDFRDASAHSEVEKRPRLPWFERLIRSAEKASAYPVKAARTAFEVVDWLDHAIAPSLAVAMSVFKGDLSEFVGLMERGRSRWKPRHVAMVAELGVG